MSQPDLIQYFCTLTIISNLSVFPDFYISYKQGESW